MSHGKNKKEKGMEIEIELGKGPMDAEMEDSEDTGSPAQEGPEEHDDHEVEMAAHHMMEAEKVKANPSLHAAVKKHLSAKKEAISKITSIDDLKKMRNKKMKS